MNSHAVHAALCITVEELLIDKCTHGSDQAIGAADPVEAFLLLSVAPTPQTGLQLYERLRDKLRMLPVGCPSVDELLSGGIREGSLVELAGASAAGKTQLCHCLAANTAVRGEGVVYIDTTNSFSAQRLQSLIAGHASRQGFPAQGLLSKVSVCRVHTIHQLLACLDTLAAQLTAVVQKNSTTAVTPQPGQAAGQQQHPQQQGGLNHSTQPPMFTVKPTVLIIDSISAVISPQLGCPHHNQGFVLMLTLGRVLKALAAEHSLVVLITNHVTNARSSGQDSALDNAAAASVPGNQVPALGEAWRNQPHARIQLHAVEGPQGKRIATLTHSNLDAIGEQASFKIAGDGLWPT